METDYYKILGISREATAEQIRQAYRSKAKLYHPDINNTPNAKILFQQINEAYQVLVNPEKKRWYDFKLKYPTTTNLKPEQARRRTATYESYYRAYANAEQEKKEEKEFVRYKKTLLDNFLFYFLVVAGIIAIVSSIISLFSEDESKRSVSGIVFGVWFLGLLFYGWNLMSRK
jgi:curved DNA-binding protein CbpA